MDLSPAWFGVYKLAKFAIYPLSWIVLAAGLAFVTTFLQVTPRRTAWLRRWTLSTVLLVLLTATPLLSNSYMAILEGLYPPFRSESSMRFDAIVVLAGGILPKGSLRPVDELMDASRQRTVCGATYWRAGLAPRMLPVRRRRDRPSNRPAGVPRDETMGDRTRRVGIGHSFGRSIQNHLRKRHPYAYASGRQPGSPGH